MSVYIYIYTYAYGVSYGSIYMCMYGYTIMSVVILRLGLRQPQASSRVWDSGLKVFNAGCGLTVERT